MKKIILGCAAVLLSLGLLAGCNNDDVDDKINNTGPEENEPTDDGNEGTTDTGPGEVIPGGDGDGDTSGTVIKTGKLGFYSESLSSYYYFDGTTTTSSNREWGATTTTWEDAIDVTLTQYDEGETLSWVSEGTTYYLGGTYDSSVGFEITATKTYINYNETYDSIETVAEDYFLGSYGTFTTIGWCAVSYYDEDYIAHVYTEEQKVPAPTSENITISGPNSVYVDSTITLTATVDAGYDQSIVWSTESEYATVDANTGVVTGVAEGSATIKATSGASEDAYATYAVEVVALPVGVSLLGTFDFTGCTATGTAISSSTDLDTYWTGDSSLYLGIRDYGTVYLGGGGNSGNYPSDQTECLKFGTSSAGGSIQLKFALGTSITQVVLTAFAWNTGSKIESSDFTVNGITQACSTNSGPEELTYDITEDWTYLLTMESSARCTVHSISIYGTYDPSNIIEPESISLSAEQSEITTEEITHVDISWSPDKALLDFDNVSWTVNDEQIATISVNVSTNNVTVHGVGAGEAAITATYGDLTSSVTIQIVAAADDPTLIGKLDFTTHVSASNTAFTQSTLQTALNTSYSGESSLVAGSATGYCYPGSNGSGDGVKGNADCIQIGGSGSGKYTGYFTISFADENIEVARISIVAAYYDSSTTLTIGDTSFSVSENSTSFNDWESFTAVEHSASFGNSIYIASTTTSNNHRILLHSITFYSA